MYLSKLTISSPGKVIRDIEFHKGLNLIVDETPENTTGTGNNVGKTTVLRLIDYCLGGDVDGIYRNPEDKHGNYALVKDFLTGNNVIVTLILVDDLDTPSEKVVIERDFKMGRSSLIRINGKDVTRKDFVTELESAIFPKVKTETPSFRQIIAHNIRIDNLRLENTLKTLTMGKNEEYEALYLFMFGCPNDSAARKTQLGRVEKGMIKKLEYRKSIPYGVTPRNAGQYFAQEALMQPADKAPLVIIKGMAGTSKTFYTLAVGLEKVLNNPTGEYRRILISRPNAQFDSDIGFLPGDEQEKISPLMRPIIDNLEQLIDSNEEERYKDEMELQGKIDEIFERGLIQTEALNYIRGRSIVKTYLIIDEAQNMTPNQVKGIITRAGKGTKIILLGDTNQIDRPMLDERTNGLSFASEYMKGSPLCWQITFSPEECERSALAMDAITRL